jgi:hypothetical protein
MECSLNDITRFEAFFYLFIVVGCYVYLIIVGEDGVVLHIWFQVNCAMLSVMINIYLALIFIGVLLEIFWGEYVETGDDLFYYLF